MPVLGASFSEFDKTAYKQNPKRSDLVLHLVKQVCKFTYMNLSIDFMETSSAYLAIQCWCIRGQTHNFIKHFSSNCIKSMYFPNKITSSLKRKQWLSMLIPL